MDDDFTSEDESDNYNDDQTFVTKEGLKNLKIELDNLKKVRRQEVAARLKEAISYGDLSENSEYEEAKNEQAFVEGRILELENKIKNAKIITDKKEKGKSVEIGSTVNITNKTAGTDPESFTIVGSTEANPTNRKISNESPIGRSLISRRKGEIVTIETPGGIVKYEINKVS
ncbi:transcription elongation factor GreA [Candidatus Peregrinibacteria bacterium]|jgi:transcription elongation factor GreA|nr:transcription elongation factor GreA [Candidatus Peregrinibacteria bacterium]MBT3598461.1 transcription elongation factor GreA [Candidatus Peregrinibacteria bacterium]MBT4367122.1 transcription elongation factor GreA [Candidatus Peregrinibacteria bacterium]MBT4585991.1 transcription elongation factor GreA [Candidatus Peregrinibacteria bacterium]MBT6730870.1 transcription elongation factor GreA [Candidatus Peregrinibacteria bacterium]